ncbi:hypothetical protein [Nocardia gamkensis]
MPGSGHRSRRRLAGWDRGVYRTEYNGITLRDHLGLREPLTRRS